MKPRKWPRLSTYVGVASCAVWLAVILHPGTGKDGRVVSLVLLLFVVADLIADYTEARRDRS